MVREAGVASEVGEETETLTYRGETKEITDVLLRYADSPDFFEYEMAVTTGKNGKKKYRGTTQDKKILDRKEMWRDLAILQSNLSFPRKQYEESLDEVSQKKNGTSWPRQLSEAEVAEWKEVMVNRLIFAGHHISHAQATNPNNPWIVELFGNDIFEPKASIESTASPVLKRPSASVDNNATGDGEPVVKRPASSVVPPLQKRPSSEAAVSGDVSAARQHCLQVFARDFSAGYDRHRGSAWRAPSNQPTKREFTKHLFISKATGPDDFAHAAFKDGFSLPIPDYTVSELRKQRLVEYSCGGVIIERDHSSGTRYSATFVKRDDRLTLWSVPSVGDKRKKMVSMLYVTWFKDDVPIYSGSPSLPDMYDKADRCAF